MRENNSNDIEKLKKALRDADAVLIGAGAGLSTAAGYTYSGERFNKYFADFSEKYGIKDMYSGGFYPYSSMEEYWAWWSRHIWLNRYVPIPNDTYDLLLELVSDKDYFVLTTNVDHCFQRAGFDKERLFYTQGDYGLLQSSKPRGKSAHMTYDNESMMREMLIAQGFEIAEDGTLIIPEDREVGYAAPAKIPILMRIPSELIPYCPDDGELMTTNLRADGSFVEDEGWHKAAKRYEEFLSTRNGKILFLELGVGYNTPVIIKYPFWKMTLERQDATYACINFGEAYVPDQIKSKSICIDGDIRKVLEQLR